MFGVDGEATPLDGERDRNFRIDGPDGSFVLKIGNPADPAEVVEMQVLAMEHALRADATLPIAHPRRTLDRRPTGAVDDRRRRPRRPARQPDRRDGRSRPGPRPRRARRAVGVAVARLDQALAGFAPSARSARHPLGCHPASRAASEARSHRSQSTGARRALARPVRRRDRRVAGARAGLDDPRRRQPRRTSSPTATTRDRVAGIVDFGDLVHARTVIDPRSLPPTRRSAATTRSTHSSRS